MNSSDCSLYASSQQSAPIHRTSGSISTSGEHSCTSLQPHCSYPKTYRDFGGFHNGLIDYNVGWDCLGDLPSGYYYEDRSLLNTSRVHSDKPYLLQPDVSDATAQYFIRPPRMRTVSSEHHTHYTRDGQQQTTRASPQVERLLEVPYTYSIDNRNPDPYQELSPIFSSSSPSPDRPLSGLNLEASQSSFATASKFDGSCHDDSDEGEKESSEPYAKLIYRALMSAPEHRMVLKDIYKWFERNTTKARDAKTKGWQNSIRHNLSMNGVKSHYETDKWTSANVPQGFDKIQVSNEKDGPNKGWIWVLNPSAVASGIQSTTRYRKTASSKRTGKSKEQGRPPIPRSISPRMTTNELGDDHYSSPRTQYSSFIDTSPDRHFSENAARFEVDSDYGVYGQLAEPPPYYSLPGSPMALGCAHVVDTQPLEDFSSHNTQSGGGFTNQ